MDDERKQNKGVNDQPDHWFVKWRSAKPWLDVLISFSAQTEKEATDYQNKNDSDLVVWDSLKPFLEILRDLFISYGLLVKDQASKAETEERTGVDFRALQGDHLVRWKTWKEWVRVIEMLVDFQPLKYQAGQQIGGGGDPDPEPSGGSGEV